MCHRPSFQLSVRLLPPGHEYDLQPACQGLVLWHAHGLSLLGNLGLRSHSSFAGGCLTAFCQCCGAPMPRPGQSEACQAERH